LKSNRILRSEKGRRPASLGATKYELVINIKTVKALGLDVSATNARPS